MKPVSPIEHACFGKGLFFNCFFELMSLDQLPHSGKRLMRLLKVRRPGWNRLTAPMTEDRTWMLEWWEGILSHLVISPRLTY